MRIIFESDDAAAMHLIMHLAARLSNAGLRAFLSGGVLSHLRGEIEDRFATETDPDGNPWTPLADATIQIREAKGFGPGPINQRTGDMRRFITGNYFVGELGGAYVLQLPGKNPSGELAHKLQVAAGVDEQFPARPILGLNENDMAFVVGSLGTWLAGEDTL